MQEEILTNKRADEWARVEHLDHEINRAKAMAKAADRTQESTKNPDKEPNKQDPQVNKPPLMEATPRSAPDGESVAQTTEKSDRNFLTIDESGDVVKGTWNSEKYRKNQLLMGELRKDQDRIREKKKLKKIGHISAQEQESQETPIVETSPGGAAQGTATGGEPESQTQETRIQRPIKNLGELRVVLSDVNLRKNKNPKHTPSKSTAQRFQFHMLGVG